MESRASAYLGCAEPSLASAVSARQLRGVLTLSALLSESVLVSDVQVADNAHFLESYASDSRYGLYQHLRALNDLGIVKLLLRRESIRPQSDVPIFECDSFADVYRSWEVQHSKGSLGALPANDETRLPFLQDVDSWSSKASLIRYDYGAIKLRYMTLVRELYGSGAFAPYLNRPFLSSHGSMRAYEDILQRDWFSLSDFYQFFQSIGLDKSDAAVQVHGLVNETSYSSELGSSLVGADIASLPLEDAYWPYESWATRRNAGSVAIEDLLDRATRVLDAPALSTLGLLSGEEIASLRAQGRGYFDLLYMIGDPHLGTNRPTIESLALAAAQYWEAICEHLAATHPDATHRPRKLALLAGSVPGSIRRSAKGMFSFALNVGVPLESPRV